MEGRYRSRFKAGRWSYHPDGGALVLVDWSTFNRTDIHFPSTTR
jgi:hypothetical protein